jgi:transposase
MGREMRAEYNQLLLLPRNVEEWVGATHPARMVRELVDSLDLDALGFAKHDEVDGAPYYGANLLLKVWLYGYFMRVRSSRKLEHACREQLALMWLAGQHQPDHNTLWRFFRANRTPLRQVFKAVVRYALKAGAVGVALHAVDGTKIAAQASRRRVWEQKRLESALEGLDAAVEEVLAQTEQNDAQERPSELPPDWRQTALQREMLRELHQELESSERRYIHPLEREARVMPAEGRKVPAYNAQIAVDSTSGLIVGETVTTEETDNHQLVRVLDEVRENTGTVAAETTADAGYHNGAELAKAAARQYPVVVHEPPAPARPRDPAGEFHSARFVYDAEQDCCTCPRGVVLRFEGLTTPRGSHDQERRYRCERFRTCPVRAQCSADPRGRSIDIGKHYGAVRRHREKLRDPSKAALLRRRKAIVEAPFGTIKEGMGFRRWTVAGVEAVRAQWALICTVFNLRILHRGWVARQVTFAA